VIKKQGSVRKDCCFWDAISYSINEAHYLNKEKNEMFATINSER